MESRDTPFNTRAPSTVRLRFYGPLDQIKSRKGVGPEYRAPCIDPRSVKDLIEAEGVPHTEVAMVLVDGTAVGLDQVLRGGERVSVFPMFMRLGEKSVFDRPGRAIEHRAFVADVHLGKLARRLRLLGMDCAWGNSLTDEEIAELGFRESRTVLTRDRQLLMRRQVVSGIFIQSTRTQEQVHQVLERLFPLPLIRPYTRCLDCNGLLKDVPPMDVTELLPPRTRPHVASCIRCTKCGKAYWKGAHWKAIEEWVARTLKHAETLRAWESEPPPVNPAGEAD